MPADAHLPAHLALGLFLALAFTAFSTPPARVNPQSQADEERAIRSVVDQIETATATNDGDTLGNLWAADYMFVNPAGQRLTRDERVRTFQTGNMKLEQYTKDEEAVRLYGTTALVFFRSSVTGARGGMDISSRRRVTMVLAKREGRWLAVSQQSSRIQPNATAAAIARKADLLKPDPRAPAEDTEREVRRTEQQISDALDKNDATALERLWAPEFIWIGPAGNILTRADRLNDIRTGNMSRGSYATDQERIRVFGSSAVVMFRSKVAAMLSGKDISSQRSVTNVLVRSGGRWRAVSQHSTIIEQR